MPLESRNCSYPFFVPFPFHFFFSFRIFFSLIRLHNLIVEGSAVAVNELAVEPSANVVATWQMHAKKKNRK